MSTVCKWAMYNIWKRIENGDISGKKMRNRAATTKMPYQIHFKWNWYRVLKITPITACAWCFQFRWIYLSNVMRWYCYWYIHYFVNAAWLCRVWFMGANSCTYKNCYRKKLPLSKLFGWIGYFQRDTKSMDHCFSLCLCTWLSVHTSLCIVIVFVVIITAVAAAAAALFLYHIVYIVIL